MDTTSLQAALQISEKAIASSSLIASWTAVILGALSILVTIGIVFVGAKYLHDTRKIEGTIRQEVALATAGFRSILSEKMIEERGAFFKEIDFLKKEISLVWTRNVVTSKDKDPHAIAKAIEMAVETGNQNYALAMVSELHDYGMKNPNSVGGFYWNAMKFDELIHKTKSIPGMKEDALEILTAYEKDIAELVAANPHKAPKRS